MGVNCNGPGFGPAPANRLIGAKRGILLDGAGRQYVVPYPGDASALKDYETRLGDRQSGRLPNDEPVPPGGFPKQQRAQNKEQEEAWREEDIIDVRGYTYPCEVKPKAD